MLGRDFRLRTQRTLEGLGIFFLFSLLLFWDFKSAHSYLYPKAKQLYTSVTLFSFSKQTFLMWPHLKNVFLLRGKTHKETTQCRFSPFRKYLQSHAPSTSVCSAWCACLSLSLLRMHSEPAVTYFLDHSASWICVSGPLIWRIQFVLYMVQYISC